MKIAIDAMGGDHAPELIVKGALQAARELPDAHLILVGDATRIKELFATVTPPVPENVEIVHAPEVIATDEEPVKAVKPVGSSRKTRRNGASTRKPRKPRTTEGSPPSNSTRGFRISRIQRGAISEM